MKSLRYQFRGEHCSAALLFSLFRRSFTGGINEAACERFSAIMTGRPIVHTTDRGFFLG